MHAVKQTLLGGASALALLASGASAATFEFSFTGAIQTGTITQTGLYQLVLGGATGGGSQYYSGGKGALVSGQISLSAGTAFAVLVGGNGTSNAKAGGGGGLSFFDIGNDGAFEAIAGGGGGAGDFSKGVSGYATASGFHTGTDGAGGAGVIGAGGAGVFGAGGAGQNGAAGGATGPTWAGGAGKNAGAGGFGGGGGGDKDGGGGGGGYTGGNGASFNGGGGGGGSHLAAAFTNPVLTTGGATTGAFVTLDLISAPPPIPTPGAFGLMGTSLLALGAMARRRRKTS